MLRVLAYRLLCLFYKPTVDGLVKSFEFTASQLENLAEAESARATAIHKEIHDLEMEMELADHEAGRAAKVASNIRNLISAA